MNLWARRLGLMLLSALPFFSCQEEELKTIGLPPENNLGIFFADIPMSDRVSEVWAGDIPSSSSGSILAGNYEDPFLGQINAMTYTKVFMPYKQPGKVLKEDAQFDSLVLEMRVREATGNNLSSNYQTIEVYQLSDSLDISGGKYNKDTQDVGMMLGAQDLLIHADSVGLSFDETDLPDSAEERSLYDAGGQYIYMNRIRLDDAFGQTFFNDIKTDTTSSGNFGTAQNFTKYFPGLRINGTPANSAVIDYNPDDSRTRMVMYYTQTEEDSVVHKTFSFSLGSVTNYHNLEPNEEVTWTGEELLGLKDYYSPYVPEGDHVFLQSGTNLFMKLDFSGFRDFADSIDSPIIQGAELVFDSPTGASDSQSERYPLPGGILVSITSLDSLENRNYSAISTVSSELARPTTLIYDTEDDLYRMEIPVYLQTIINNNNIYDQVILRAAFYESTTNSYYLNNRNIQRLIMDKDNIKLRIYYSIPNAVK